MENDLNKLWEEKINLLNESLRLTYYFIKNDHISYKWKTIDFFGIRKHFKIHNKKFLTIIFIYSILL